MRKFFLSLALMQVLISIEVYAQVIQPFKVRFQKYVEGDMAIISNNILKRADFYIGSNNAYHTRSHSNKLNDEFTMKYIDIDDDPATFSSSSADFILPPNNRKIVYAGLYRYGTYVYNSGSSSKTNKFKAIDAKRENFETVKLKLPFL